MTTIVDFMTADHRSCDKEFAAVEAAVSDARWDAASEGWAAFVASLERHFTREEKVLFPAFEEATGNTAGPTQMMRMEHEQMRELCSQLADAVARRDGEGFLGRSETLMVLIQQHNMKEEQILYPMCDRTLADVVRVLADLESQPHAPA